MVLVDRRLTEWQWQDDTSQLVTKTMTPKTNLSMSNFGKPLFTLSRELVFEHMNTQRQSDAGSDLDSEISYSCSSDLANPPSSAELADEAGKRRRRTEFGPRKLDLGEQDRFISRAEEESDELADCISASVAY